MEKAPFYPEVAEGPQDVHAYWLKADDGIRLRAAHWPITGDTKGTVFIFQGRTENMEKYGLAVAQFQADGYHAFAIDWRGQGLSDRLTDDRMMGHVGSYRDYQRDVRAFLKAARELDLPKPWVLFGHSLGACVGLQALTDGLPVKASAFTAPLWDINLPTFHKLVAWPLSWAAQAFGKGASYAPGTQGESYVLTTEFSENRLTHDPEMYRYYQRVSENLVDQQVGGPSIGWLFQTMRETRRLSKLGSPSVPCIAFCGAEDTIVALTAVEERMKRWTSGTFDLVANARHDVLYESADTRAYVFRSILNHFQKATGCHPAASVYCTERQT
jgi:lysophospholipase